MSNPFLFNKVKHFICFFRQHNGISCLESSISMVYKISYSRYFGSFQNSIGSILEEVEIS